MEQLRRARAQEAAEARQRQLEEEQEQRAERERLRAEHVARFFSIPISLLIVIRIMQPAFLRGFCSWYQNVKQPKITTKMHDIDSQWFFVIVKRNCLLHLEGN